MYDAHGAMSIAPADMGMESMVPLAMQHYNVATVTELESIAIQMGMTLPTFLSSFAGGMAMPMDQYDGMMGVAYNPAMGAYGGYDAYTMDPATAGQMQGYSPEEMQYADPAAAQYYAAMGYSVMQPPQQAAPQLDPAAASFVPPAYSNK